MTKTMTIKRFKALIGSFGTNAARWPDAERDQALELLKSDSQAAELFEAAAGLDALLGELPAPKPADKAFIKRLATIPFGAAALGADQPTTFGEFIHGLFPRRRLVPQAGLVAAAVFGVWLGIAFNANDTHNIVEVDAGQYLFDETGVDQDLKDLR